MSPCEDPGLPDYILLEPMTSLLSESLDCCRKADRKESYAPFPFLLFWLLSSWEFIPKGISRLWFLHKASIYRNCDLGRWRDGIFWANTLMNVNLWKESSQRDHILGPTTRSNTVITAFQSWCKKVLDYTLSLLLIPSSTPPALVFPH